MNQRSEPDLEAEERAPARLLDVLVRAGLILALALLCYRVFAPFLVLMVWALILAVTLYPLHQAVARRIGERQGLAATLITVLGVVLIVAPTALLLSSMGDSVQQLVRDVQHDTLQVPPPRPNVAAWPVVGKKVYALWERAHADLPGLVQSLQPKIGDLATAALAMVASIGGAILQFIGALIIAGIIMAFGQPGDRSSRAIFARLVGGERGAEFSHLAVTTIRAVAQGVIGVAFIQAIIVGVCLLIAGVPWAGVLAGIVLVLGIAQVPAALVTLPVIAYIWASGDYGHVAAIAYTILLFVSGLADNVLKPLMLGRGVDAPMPVILLGALGGMAAAGILGMFVGATLLALGYQIFMGWVAANPEGAGPTNGARRRPDTARRFRRRDRGSRADDRGLASSEGASRPQWAHTLEGQSGAE
jgi:predicted PurR-regulated permease PerM